MPIFATQTATNYAEFISLPDLSGTGPLLTLADPDFAIARMSAFHQLLTIARTFDVVEYGRCRDRCGLGVDMRKPHVLCRYSN